MQTPSVRLQGLFLFGCPRTSPLNIKRGTLPYVSVVIVQAIMPERMESGVTIPRVQCSSVKCKMNILRREGAEMWCCFPWGSQWKVTLDLLCVLKWAYVESARDKPLSSLSDNWVFFFFLSSRNCYPASQICSLKICFIDLKPNCFPVPPDVRKIQVLL